MRLQEAHTLFSAGVSAWLVKGQNWGLICLFVFFFFVFFFFLFWWGKEGKEGGRGMARWCEVKCKLITYLLSKSKCKMLIGTAGRKKNMEKKNIDGPVEGS